MPPIANTPKPPCFAVIAPMLLDADVKGYPEPAPHLMELTKQIDCSIARTTREIRATSIDPS
jgi:hypothetical protein